MSDTAPDLPEEMVEKVARAICQERGDPPDRLYSYLTEDGVTVRSHERWYLYVPAARAAIKAMQAPSAAMIDAGAASHVYPSVYMGGPPEQSKRRASRMWKAMISQALGRDSQ